MGKVIHSLGDRSMSVRRSVDTFTRVGLSFTERKKGVTYDRGKGERDLGWLSQWLVGEWWGLSLARLMLGEISS